MFIAEITELGYASVSVIQHCIDLYRIVSPNFSLINGIGGPQSNYVWPITLGTRFKPLFLSLNVHVFTSTKSNHFLRKRLYKPHYTWTIKIWRSKQQETKRKISGVQDRNNINDQKNKQLTLVIWSILPFPCFNQLLCGLLSLSLVVIFSLYHLRVEDGIEKGTKLNPQVLS